MSQLFFEDKALSLIEFDGRLWLRSADIARALGYNRADRITQIYDRRKAEFSPSMTCVAETFSLGHNGGGSIRQESRLFSLRGAHLLGMFARTAVGVKFRRWVLDQIEVGEAANSANRSLMHQWFEVKAKLEGQQRFASFCGKGLSQHKKIKPPLAERLNNLSDQIQPSLFLN